MRQLATPKPASTIASLAGGWSTDALDALMVFDGVCNFCSRSVKIVMAMDRAAVISFAPIQSPLGKALCQSHGLDPDNPTTFLFFDRGAAFEATDGMAALLARLDPPWRWLRGFKVLPRAWRDAVYRLVARNRYRWFGRKVTCMVPSDAVRGRFADLSPADP